MGRYFTRLTDYRERKKRRLEEAKLMEQLEEGFRNIFAQMRPQAGEKTIEGLPDGRQWRLITRSKE